MAANFQHSILDVTAGTEMKHLWDAFNSIHLALRDWDENYERSKAHYMRQQEQRNERTR